MTTTSTTSTTPPRVPNADRLLDSLARATDLVIPPSVLRAGGGEGEVGRRDYLADLLQRDPALFLERHGKHLLGAGDLRLFHHLRGDYEVDFHLNKLTAAIAPSPEQSASHRRTVKNRRLAHMMRTLDHEGYFLEDAMRRREPLLYDVFVGGSLGGGGSGARPWAGAGAGAGGTCGDGGTGTDGRVRAGGAPPGDTDTVGGCKAANGVRTAGDVSSSYVSEGGGCGGGDEDVDESQRCLAANKSVHAVSMSLLEREDDRLAALKLREQRRELRAREEMEEEEEEEEEEDVDIDKTREMLDKKGGDGGKKATSSDNRVTPGFNNGVRIRAGGPRATPTSDELRRAMLAGWGGRGGRGQGQEDEMEPDGRTTHGGEERDKIIIHSSHPHASSSSGHHVRGLPPTEASAAAVTVARANEVDDDDRHMPPYLHERTCTIESEREQRHEREREQRVEHHHHDIRLAEFQRVMRERYMNGEDDAYVDYRRIDADQSLDDTWRREATQDAEDAWFDEDEDMEEEEQEGGGVDDFDDTL